MIKNLGQEIRTLRIEKGIGLNEFSSMIDVSPGYLSNLETGKTDNIHLSVLEKIQKELDILPLHNKKTISQDFEIRLKRIENKLSDVNKLNNQSAEFLLDQLEFSLDWHLKQK